MHKWGVVLLITIGVGVIAYLVITQPSSQGGRLLTPREIHQLIQQGRHGQAIEASQRGIQAKPQMAGYYLLLGEAFEAQGRASEALKIYQEMIKALPQTPEPYFFLGRLLYGQGQTTEAVEVLEKSTRLSLNLTGEPRKINLLMGYSLLGKIYYEDLKNNRKAKEVYEKIVGLDPTNHEIHYRLGVIYAAEGDIKEAAVKFRRVIRNAPGTSLSEASKQALEALEEKSL